MTRINLERRKLHSAQIQIPSCMTNRWLSVMMSIPAEPKCCMRKKERASSLLLTKTSDEPSNNQERQRLGIERQAISNVANDASNSADHHRCLPFKQGLSVCEQCR